MVYVAIVSLGENKDWIGPWMTFYESPKITVDTSTYMHSLLFRYLDWNQSWMRQTAEVYDIHIDSNLKWLWPFRLINSFTAYHHFLLKHSLSKLSSLIKAWTCLIFPTFSGITESPLKSLSISRILTLLLFAISTKVLLEISFSLQPGNFWSWCSEFHSAIMILCGLTVSVSTCWTCCHRWPYLYSW